MTLSIIDEPQRKAARVAGFTFLFSTAIVILANFGINFRLIVPGNAVDTARNIMAHETLFRFNIVCNLIYVVTIVAMVAALYVTLGAVHRNLALVAAFCRLVFAVMWGVTALNSLGTLRLLGDVAYLQVFGVDQLQSLARLHIASNYDAYYVGLPFWGVASTVCGYLWFKSGYIPRALSAFGVTSSAWCVICAFAYLVLPNFSKTVGLWWFDMPMVLFELGAGYWLLFKGLKPSGIAGPHTTRDGQ